MQSLNLHTHIGKDGILKVEMPAKFRDSEVDVVLVVNPAKPSNKSKTKKAKGWPPGFFERTFGSIPDFPERGRKANMKLGTRWNEILTGYNACIGYMNGKAAVFAKGLNPCQPKMCLFARSSKRNYSMAR